MSTALRKTHKIAAIAASVWLMAGHVHAEGKQASDEPKAGRWIQLGERKNDLPSVRDLIGKLSEETRKNVRVCITDGKYSVVVPEGKRGEKAEGGIPENPVEIAPNKCFKPIHFFAVESTKNRAVKKIPPPSEEKGPVRLDIRIPGTGETYSKVVSEPVRIQPDVTTQLSISNLDVNRFTCMGGEPISDVVYSEEKGVIAKVNGSNVFVKLQKYQNPSTMRAETVKEPVEIYVVCGQRRDVYTVIGMPKKIPARWIQLETKRDLIGKNVSLFSGMPFEKKILKVMKQAWFGEYPDTYKVVFENRKIAISGLEWLDVRLIRKIDIEGEGLQVGIFNVGIAGGAEFAERKVSERNFILPELAENPVGITLSNLTLRKGGNTKLFVIEGKNAFNTENLEIMEK